MIGKAQARATTAPSKDDALSFGSGKGLSRILDSSLKQGENDRSSGFDKSQPKMQLDPVGSSKATRYEHGRSLGNIRVVT